MQRMGGINAVCLSLDQTQMITVGQEKRITFWDFNNPSPVHDAALNGEHEEAFCITR
jgi:hypothetical protein